jgi:DNA repair protein RecN (Recombination protein N)
MLTYISISNYTIAEHIELELQRGMTAITGETGAGKSLMIDALEYCLGARADTNAIRIGSHQLEIIAHFDISKHPKIQTWLEEHQLASDGECLLRRIVKNDGRSLNSINGVTVPLQITRQLSHHLVTIHGQHEHQLLLKRDTHRAIVDAHANADQILASVHQAYQDWYATQEKIEALSAKESAESRIEFLQFQLHELQQLNLHEGELEKLEQEHRQLTHSETLINHCHQAIHLLKENEQVSISGQLHQALKLLAPMQSLHTQMQSAHELLTTALIHSEEALDALNMCLRSFNTEPQRLNDLETRLQLIYDIARKHRVKTYDIPKHRLALEQELVQLTERDRILDEWREKLNELAKYYFTQAKALTELRLKTARKLSKQLTDSVHQLGMPNASCHIEIQTQSPREPHPQGMETLEIFIVTNPGATPMPLKKIASGGELSRISLALQVIAAKTLATPILLFDEVDVGIGGATAATVGQLLHQLGKEHQVICVTHQPQVAAQGNHHLRVEKEVINQTTSSTVRKLNQQERIEEIARMLGGHKITEQTRAHAEEMLMS